MQRPIVLLAVAFFPWVLLAGIGIGYSLGRASGPRIVAAAPTTQPDIATWQAGQGHTPAPRAQSTTPVSSSPTIQVTQALAVPTETAIAPTDAALPAPTDTPLPPTKTAAPTPEDDRHIEASLICEKFVKDRLKSPSTAEFASLIWDGITVEKEGDVYSMRSWVDSQNGFGAMIRTQFLCKVRPEGDQWRLVDLQTE